jgi:hypothetical protein
MVRSEEYSSFGLSDIVRKAVVINTPAPDSMWGPMFTEAVDALPGMEIIDRSSVNAFDDTRVAVAVEATGHAPRRLSFWTHPRHREQNIGKHG